MPRKRAASNTRSGAFFMAYSLCSRHKNTLNRTRGLYCEARIPSTDHLGTAKSRPFF
jgi:hypothetical protein